MIYGLRTLNETGDKKWIDFEWMNQGFDINLERILKHGMKMWQEKWYLIFFEKL